ncbi:MAG: hypothetical protein WBW93_05980 [Steroidobacteraceae bacterium]
MSQREYLDGPVPLTVDERQRKWSEAYPPNTWRVLDRILRWPLADPLDYLQKVISVASTEAFTPRLVEGDLSEVFRFRRRVEARSSQQRPCLPIDLLGGDQLDFAGVDLRCPLIGLLEPQAVEFPVADDLETTTFTSAKRSY